MITNGNFFVCIFLVVSGLVLSWSLFDPDKAAPKLSSIALKRYFRLVAPAVVVCALVYVLMIFDLLKNQEISGITGSSWLHNIYNWDAPSVKDFLTTSLISMWFVGTNFFSTAFWMLSVAFYGSFLAMFCAMMVWGRNSRIVWVWIALAVGLLCLKQYQTYLACFPLGTALAYYFATSKNRNGKAPSRSQTLLNVTIVLVGLLYGGYPTGVEHPTNIYHYLPVLDFGSGKAVSAHVFGAVALLYGIHKLAWIQRILEHKVFLFLGDLSYSLYLLHIPILCTVTIAIFQGVYGQVGSYKLSVLIALVLSLMIIVFVSHLFYRFIEIPLTKATNRFIAPIGTDETNGLPAVCAKNAH
ncbi:acyltransferase family protein [Arcanobacterium bovis]|uniref:acyltransferase family protein n=1 Tax=Arcanobacterium bovis TaxID=2529275 RepID=UPI0013F16F4F|nr:acyltransferase [Arcanobacterium bovis]